ncbi:MAG: hypothetical protein IAF08_04395 [Rhizobacter sp.]|nr:hypothetical protein [Chlorobiales bacterium]
MEKIAIKVRLGEQPRDTAYWRAQSAETRIAAVEELRRNYHLWKHNAEPRLQRVYRIVKR